MTEFSESVDVSLLDRLVDTRTLIKWDDKRLPARPGKMNVWGALFVIFTVCAILFYFFHPYAAVLALILAAVSFGLGTIAYKKEEARADEINKHCRQCGKMMEECVVDFQKSQLDRAVLSRTALLQRFIVKDKLFECSDERIYMIGKKSRAPGHGYAAWIRTGFLLKAKWFVCFDCRSAYIYDTIFETLSEGDEEVKAFSNDKKEIIF